MPPRDRLTSKEKIVAILVWEGHTNREIAARINTSEQVVKNHLRSTFDKLGVWSRLELALYVAAHGGATWEGTGSVAAGAEPVLGPVLGPRLEPRLEPGLELGMERIIGRAVGRGAAGG